MNTLSSLCVIFILWRPCPQGTHDQLMRTIHKGGTTWVLQNENNEEQRDSVHTQTHFNANDNMK
jgi:hypothetical protein